MRKGAQIAVGFAVLAGCIPSTDGYTGGPAADAGPSSAIVDAAAGVDSAPAPSEAGTPDAGHPYIDAVLSDKPLGYWHLDEPSGSTVFHDEMGAHDLTVDDVSHLSFGDPGVVGQSIHLDGTPALVMNGTFDVAGTTPYTVEAWVKTTDTTNRYREIFAKQTFTSSGPQDGMYLWMQGSVPQLGFERWKGGSGVDGIHITGALAGDRFTHIVVVVSPTASSILYLDGTPTVSVTAAKLGVDPMAPVKWGATWNGSLDELGFYGTMLSADRVLAHYKAGTAH